MVESPAARSGESDVARLWIGAFEPSGKQARGYESRAKKRITAVSLHFRMCTAPSPGDAPGAKREGLPWRTPVVSVLRDESPGVADLTPARRAANLFEQSRVMRFGLPALAGQFRRARRAVHVAEAVGIVDERAFELDQRPLRLRQFQQQL